MQSFCQYLASASCLADFECVAAVQGDFAAAAVAAAVLAAAVAAVDREKEGSQVALGMGYSWAGDPWHTAKGWQCCRN